MSSRRKFRTHGVSSLSGGKRSALARSNVAFRVGWSGGPYGVGHRMPIQHTRSIVRAALMGALDRVPTRPDPILGLAVPTVCPDVPADVLDPRCTWLDPQAYDAQARRLADLFAANIRKLGDAVPDDVRMAGPRVR
jgi:phosphoenolpyruvate carboxykinase (ATP)